MKLGRVVPRRFPTRLLLLVTVLVLTYIPQFKIPTYRREEARGIVTVAMALWLRTWALQIGRQLPNRQRKDDPPDPLPFDSDTLDELKRKVVDAPQDR